MAPSEDITQRAAEGDKPAARELFQLVYRDLRRVAASKLAGESPGQTMTATALVHEAFLKLGPESKWNDSTHLFRTAAQVMRQILIDAARRKSTQKHGGSLDRKEFVPDQAIAGTKFIDPVEMDEAIRKLELANPTAAAVFDLRHYAELSMKDIASQLSISVEKAETLWTYAVAKFAQILTPPT